MGTLFYGDRRSRFPPLDILTRDIADESADLVYLDPPFNSAQNYNALFQEKDGTAAAQIQVFEDTWEWSKEPRSKLRGIDSMISQFETKPKQASGYQTHWE